MLRRAQSHHETDTTIALLKDCIRHKDLSRGTKLHADISRNKSLMSNVIVQNMVLDMYAKCGALVEAQKVFNEHPERDITSWNSIILGYSQLGYSEEAIQSFESMQKMGFSPNGVIYVCVLKACGNLRAAQKGHKLHDAVTALGLVEINNIIGNALVDMYAKCGMLSEAKLVFNNLVVCDIVSWNALITGYSRHGHGEEALKGFKQIQAEGFSPDIVTFICILKTCGSIGAYELGKQLHSVIIKCVLLQKDVILGNALVDMYAKCGALDKAHQVFYDVPIRNSVSWNTLITGYVDQGLGEGAIECFMEMESAGCTPSAITLTCILKACGNIRNLEKGEEIHHQILEGRWLEKDLIVGNALIDMYAKCGVLAKARNVFDVIPIQTVVSWNVLIVGYFENGYAEEAQICFEEMQHHGVVPNTATYLSILKACSIIGSAEKGKELHAKVVYEGMLEKNDAIGCALVDMYAKCGLIMEAQDVFDKLRVQDTVSSTALISGYAEYGSSEEALKCFDLLNLTATPLDSVIYVCALKACCCILAIDKGLELHAKIVKEGIVDKNVTVGTTLMNLYANSCMQVDACYIFDSLAIQDGVSWNVLILGYVEHDYFVEPIICFHRMQLEGILPDSCTYMMILSACGTIGALDRGQILHAKTVFEGLLHVDSILGSALMDMYSKCNAFGRAKEVFDHLPIRNVAAWNSLITVYIQHGDDHKALECFENMQVEGYSPSETVYVNILNTCGRLRAAVKGQEIHAQTVREGSLERSNAICDSLVDMYIKCSMFTEAKNVFQNMLFFDIASWNNFLLCCTQHGHSDEALEIAEMVLAGFSPDVNTFSCILKACSCIRAIGRGHEMHDLIIKKGLHNKEYFLGRELVDMYAKCGKLIEARFLFDVLSIKDLMLWNVMISGYVQEGRSEEGLKCFEQMQLAGFYPDEVTFSSVLKACANINALGIGENIHSQIIKNGMLEKDTIIGNALVSMYCKFGALSTAQETFRKLSVRDTISWNVLLTGYAQNGHDEEALECFEQMKLQGFSPDLISYIGVLRACGTMKATEEGHNIHSDLVKTGLVDQSNMVGAALLDTYLNCGLFAEAEAGFCELPNVDGVSWNIRISGYSQNDHGKEVLNWSEHMEGSGNLPQGSTFVSILKACGSTGSVMKVLGIHLEVLKKGICDSDNIIGNALVDTYVKCGMLDEAQVVFYNLPCLETVSWNVLLAGYAQFGMYEIVFNFFDKLMRGSIKPNSATFVILLSACSHAGQLELAEACLKNMYIGYGVMPTIDHHSCIIDLICRVGDLEKALTIIKEIPHATNILVWNTLLGACVRLNNLEYGRQAFKHAQQLTEKNASTYVSFSNMYGAYAQEYDVYCSL